MRSLGCHVSISGGVDKALARAEELDCTAVQIFTHAPSAWAMKPLSASTARAFREALFSSAIEVAVVHTMYLLNLASPEPGLLARSAVALETECARAVSLGIPSVVTHLGSHRGDGIGRGIDRVRSVLEALQETSAWQDTACRLLVENTAGAGTAIGSTWEELSMILAGLPQDRFGICLDTCHAHAAGYDLSTPDGVETMIAGIDRSLGLQRIMLVHLNDSKYPSGSRRDRHEHIGKGKIGLTGMSALIHHPALADLPLILETPKKAIDGTDGDVRNLTLVRGLISSLPLSARP